MTMKKFSGMTFIEVLIASMIVAIVLSSMFAGLNFASKYARHNANKTMALNFAQAKMEELKGATYLELDNYNGPVENPPSLYQKDGVNIATQMNVVIGKVTIEGVIYKTVEVTISWDWQGNPQIPEVLNTLRSDY